MHRRIAAAPSEAHAPLAHGVAPWLAALLRRGVLWAALILVTWAAAGAASAADAPAAAIASAAASAEASLRVWNRPVFVFRTPMFGLTPQQRATRASERIAALPAAALTTPVEAAPITHDGNQGYAIMIRGETLFAIFDDDLEPGDPGLGQVAAQTGARLQAALAARADQGGGRRLAEGFGWVALASLLLLLVLLALQRLALVVEARTAPIRARAFQRPHFDWRRIAVSLLGIAIRWCKFALMAFAFYVWLAYALTRFPYTQPWGQTLDSSLVAVASTLAVGAIHALPDLAMVAAIFFFAHLSVRGLHAMFDAAHASGVKLAALQSDTIGATRRLTMVLVWLFAAVVAYPFIPGSDSDAFKGLSVFFGVLVTLGSSGLVSQIMSGFVLIYSRALRPGDFVQVGDVEGYVLELGTLSIKLRNRLDQEVTLPNSLVIATRIQNHSGTTKAAGGGISLSTSITIGYDTPWRQVHAMLVMAARRTPDLLADPLPTVRQLRLQDFYVEYELNVFMRSGAPKFDVLSALHGHIQDVFNEYGVQIMSPNFVLQPATPVLVAKEDFRAAPAE
ncbi:mechanosensitive ion channel family protein [Variovorax sp. J22P168]|nr:mechanosensitive ion channel family protein [Variovorax sp. J22P168]